MFYTGNPDLAVKALLIVDINASVRLSGYVVEEYQGSYNGRDNKGEQLSSDVSEGLVLIADDSESDRFFLLRAFSATGVKNPVRIVSSGAEVIRYLSGENEYADRRAYPFPKIVFLDLKMPPPSGLDVLRWKQDRTDLPRILWVAMSTFESIKTIDYAYKSGADTFLAKPLDPADIKNLIEAFNDFWHLSRAT